MNAKESLSCTCYERIFVILTANAVLKAALYIWHKTQPCCLKDDQNENKI